jgi:hypothetical protein
MVTSNKMKIEPSDMKSWTMMASEKAFSVFNNVTNSSQCINSTVTLVITNLHKDVQPTPTPNLFEARQLAAAN